MLEVCISGVGQSVGTVYRNVDSDQDFIKEWSLSRLGMSLESELRSELLKLFEQSAMRVALDCRFRAEACLNYDYLRILPSLVSPLSRGVTISFAVLCNSEALPVTTEEKPNYCMT